MRALLTLVAGDLRQRVRDRSVIIFGLVVPIALMAVMNLVFADAEEIEFDAATVAIEAADDDELAQVLSATMEQVDAFEVTVHQVPAGQARDQVEQGGADLGIVIGGGVSEAMTTGAAAQVQVFTGPASEWEADILISVTQAVSDRFSSAGVATRAGMDLGLGPEELAAVGRAVGEADPAVTTVEGETAAEQLSGAGSMVAGQAGLFLLFTVGFGVLALINEREEGTLRRLHSMPIRRGTIVAAKALSSYLLGVGATAVLLTAGSWFFGVSFGNIWVVGLLVLCVVAAATSLMFVVARVARTAEQAGVAQAILAVVLGMFGGAFFQVGGGGLAGTLLELNPIGAFSRGLGIVAGGGQVGDLTVQIATMVGFAVVATAASRLIPDRGMER